MALFLGIVIAGLPLLVIELVVRKTRRASELTRKTTHTLSALAVVTLIAFCTLQQIAIIAAIFFVLLMVLRPKYVWNSLYAVERHSWGEILFPLGVLVAALLADDARTFIAVVLILGLSDTLASLVGQKLPRMKLPWVSHKTVAGSTAFLLSACAILAVVLREPDAAIVAALAMTIAEAVSHRGIDNLTVPLVGVIVLRLLGV
jgi:dolichol kinase